MQFYKLLDFDWQAVSAIANILLLFGLVFAYRTIKEAINTRNANILLWVMETMTDAKKPLAKVKSAPAPNRQQAVIRVSEQIVRSQLPSCQ